MKTITIYAYDNDETSHFEGNTIVDGPDTCYTANPDDANDAKPWRSIEVVDAGEGDFCDYWITLPEGTRFGTQPAPNPIELLELVPLLAPYPGKYAPKVGNNA